ncbi:heme o synthase [Marinivivus vitaminiproducens]|uniref:heme o synthase n=1 Tax=Marinivivus vitaminiproducens TaxID=3035935 RepID=UPI00279B54FD|nr:heme o synthase [Geminicoccaceae bacterium SCSIO 64248]
MSSDTVAPRLTAGEAPLQGASSVRDYVHLLKPNVMRLVVFSAWGGIYLAPGGLHPFLAFTAILCIAVAAGAAAAINNAYDADIDRVMKRTAWRPTACGRISEGDALAFGLTLAIFSVVTMGLALNWAAGGLLALTIAFYVLVYTMWLKRRTPQNIVIGGAAGAFPPMVGWAAVTGSISLDSVLLFVLIFLWTPPHFWALSLYRHDDYGRAGVPMLPVVAGLAKTRQHILAYTIVLLPVSLLPAWIGSAGLLYAAVAAVASLAFLAMAAQLWWRPSDALAKRTFAFSIVYLFALFGGLIADKALGFGAWVA